MTDGDFTPIQLCAGKVSCGKFKPLSAFEIRNDTGKPRGTCRECRLKGQKQYVKETASQRALTSKIYREKNADQISQSKNAWYQENKTTILEKNKLRNAKPEIKQYQKEYNKQYRIDNKDALAIKEKEYRNKEENKIRQNEYNKEYREKEENKRRRNERHKERMLSDPQYSIQHLMHGAIDHALKSRNISKNGSSMLNFLPFTIPELKAHVEAKFSAPENLINGKVWMTWENRGVYDPEIWNDNDASTMTWQLDHIRPEATFIYSSMEDQTFRDCWALSNLRPLNAKQNQHDGSTRVRHV